jgi:hypothetical protein
MSLASTIDLLLCREAYMKKRQHLISLLGVPLPVVALHLSGKLTDRLGSTKDISLAWYPS